MEGDAEGTKKGVEQAIYNRVNPLISPLQYRDTYARDTLGWFWTRRVYPNVINVRPTTRQIWPAPLSVEREIDRWRWAYAGRERDRVDQAYTVNVFSRINYK